MKRLLAKYSRPALTAVLVLALTMVMTVGSAFAFVEISDKFYITDEADVISEETENHIVNLNGYLEENCSGAQIGVVVVHFLDGMDIEDYCYKLFNQMQLGDAEEDNGLLLLLTIGEDNYWCMQGKGLESELTASKIDDTLWYGLEPEFAAADYDEGVLTVCNVFAEDICDIYGAPYPSMLDPTSEDFYAHVDYSSDEPLTFTDWLIFIGFCLVFMAFAVWVYTLILKLTRKIFGGAFSDSDCDDPEPYTTVRRTVRRRPRPVIYVGSGRPTHRPHHNHWDHQGHHGHGSPSSRPSSRPTSRPTSSRPTSRPTSRPSSFGGGSSFGGSRPSGSGGGGSSRGGGAGRRGR